MLKTASLTAHRAGYALMQYSLTLDNDAEFNRFSQIGNRLMNIGEPGYPRSIYDFSADEIDAINKALDVLNIES